MEEKDAKTVQMNSKEKNEETPKQMSYEELRRAAGQLAQQNKALMNQIEQDREQYREQIQRLNNVEIRLHYLFEVLDKGNYFNNDFIDKVVDEIVDIMTIKEEETKEEEESKES